MEYAYDSKSYEVYLVWVQLPPAALINHVIRKNMENENSQVEQIKKFKNGFKDELLETRRKFKERTITLILGGFGLVAALAWNEAIKSLFETFFPKTNALIGKFIYAIIITLVVVFLSLQLRKASKRENH